jgi:hypothetical protein
VRDAPGVLRGAFIGAGVEGSSRGRRSTEQKPTVVRYQEEAGYGRGDDEMGHRLPEGKGRAQVACIHGAGEQPMARLARSQEASGGGAMKLLEEGDDERTLGRERAGGLGV